MIYSALDIARFVINYEHSQQRDISNLRLQKLLYFVQAKVVCETGEPCFSDYMEAWDFGPVVPAVYYQYRIFGGMNIPSAYESSPLIESCIAEHITGVLDYCASYPTYQLVEITHQQDPWKFARMRGIKSQIYINDIRNYFVEK